ncbi:Nuclear pore complex protein NUP214 [Zea mays]|uniref:Nuclear pore complex protein NUP214 n=2 Tax=Zea mays TaxID=4577 RepID=A0A1D6PYH5_MAIZE|nr:Nuclear pore complex protein NUP214 [Zea mays]
MCLEVPALVPAGSPNANKSKSRGNDPDDDMYLMDLDGNNLKPDSTSAELGTLNEALQELIKEISSGVRENDYLTDDGVFCSGVSKSSSSKFFGGNQRSHSTPKKLQEKFNVGVPETSRSHFAAVPTGTSSKRHAARKWKRSLSDPFRSRPHSAPELVSGCKGSPPVPVAPEARQTYMKGIVSQSSDNQYWDIWNRQKLSPEFEVKRQNILRANQVLTNQLVELERHYISSSGKLGYQVLLSPRSHMSQQLEGNQHLPNPIHSALGAKIMWWLVCFIAQFGQSLVRADYLILRKGFIMVVEKSLLSVAVIPAFADGLYVYTLTRLTSKSWESQFFSLRDSFFLVM